MLHYWTKDEDVLLVESLVELRVEGKFLAERGFKPGYLWRLEEILAAKVPGHGLKAISHILSQLKTLRSSWQAIYDMVYGVNASGFGWDPKRKRNVTGEPAMWDEYLKVNYALKLTFSFYAYLCLVCLFLTKLFFVHNITRTRLVG